MICPYCHRADIPFAPIEVQVPVPTRGWPMQTTISFTAHQGMCIECARVTSFFIQKGAIAFGAELAKMKQQKVQAGAMRQLSFSFFDEMHRLQAEASVDHFIKRIGFRISQ